MSSSGHRDANNQYYFDPARFEGGRPRLPKDRTALPAARSRDVRRGGGSTEDSREPGRERSADDSRDEFSRDDAGSAIKSVKLVTGDGVRQTA